MRISENTVVQQVDGRLVIAQEGGSVEVVLSPEETARLFGAIGYFSPELDVMKEAIDTEYRRGQSARLGSTSA